MQVLPADHPLQCALLDDVPIGPMAVVEWDGELFVAFVDEHDKSRVKRIVHTLKPGENPLNAVYGKRVMESRQVQALYDRQGDDAEKSEELHEQDVGKDFRKEAWRIWNKEGGRDAFMALMKRAREN